MKEYLRRIYLCICKIPKIWRLSTQYPYSFRELWHIWGEMVKDESDGGYPQGLEYAWNLFCGITGELDW